MSNMFDEILDELEENRLKTKQYMQNAFFWACISVVALCGLLFIGCSPKPQPQSTANAIPAAVKSYEVPLEDTKNIPDQIILRPGQSAVLLKDIVVVARVPAQGNELFVGKVKIPKGTVIVSPIEEIQ